MKTELGVENVYNKSYYRTFEVLSHIKREDFWIILNRRVLDLSTLMKSIDEMPISGKNQSVNKMFYHIQCDEFKLKCLSSLITGIGPVKHVWWL